MRLRGYHLGAAATLEGIRRRNGNLSTLRRSVCLGRGVRKHVMRNTEPPPQSSWSLAAIFPIKRAVSNVARFLLVKSFTKGFNVFCCPFRALTPKYRSTQGVYLERPLAWSGATWPG
jgi:hypothetical protein